jgi:hypothetical protein
MVPSKAVQAPSREKTIDEVNAEMAAFPIGTTLCTVYACATPMSTGIEMTPTDGGLATCGTPTLLGDMVITDRCTPSKYGDTKFHIRHRHQRIEED